MKTAIVLLASVASTADAISCTTYAFGVDVYDCSNAFFGNPDNCYARMESGTTTVSEGCDYKGSSCVTSTTGENISPCSNHDNDENACITAGCTFIDLIPNYYAVIMPSGSTCCEDTEGALLALSATDFDGVEPTAAWFTANCTNPVPCLARDGTASTSVSVVAAITASVVALRSLF